MKKLVLILLAAVLLPSAPSARPGSALDNRVAAPALQAATAMGEVARWERQARNVTIVRDDWGIPHIHGKTDADAVFGLMYAQAEDDFNRVETNYLNSMGRLAEAEGEARDLPRPPDEAVHRSRRHEGAVPAASPEWLKALMNAWADGLNYYLHTPPRREAPRHHALRAVDGAHLQRGQHRRRHRARQPQPARGVLREGPAGAECAGAGDDDRGEPRGRTASRSRPATPPPATRCSGSTRTPRSSSAPRCR